MSSQIRLGSVSPTVNSNLGNIFGSDASDIQAKTLALREKIYQQDRADKLNAIATLRQREADAVQGMIAGSGYDLYTPQTEDVTSTEDVTQNAIGASGAQKLQDALMNQQGNIRDEYAYKQVGSLTQNEKALQDKYNAIQKLPNDLQKREALMNLGEQFKYPGFKEDKGVDSIAKSIWNNFEIPMREAISNIGGSIMDLGRTDKEILEADKKRQGAKNSLLKLGEESSLTNLVKKRVANIKTKQDAIKAATIFNKGIDKKQADLAKTFESPQTFTKTTTKKGVQKSRAEYAKDLRANVTKALNDLDKRADLSTAAKNKAVLGILSSHKAQQGTFDAQIKTINDIQQKQIETSIKVAGQKDVAKFKAELAAAQKALDKNPQDEELRRKKELADLAYVKAKTEAL